MTTTTSHRLEYGWAPRWYIWDGGFFAIGGSRGVVPPHAHHAIQITLGVNEDVRVAGSDGVWQSTRGFIVRPDTEHAFDGDGVDGAMLFVDPESTEGRWLLASLNRDVTTIPAARCESCAAALRTFNENPLEALEPAELVRHIVRALCAGVPPSRRLDERVTRVLATIRAAEDLRISLDDAAATVFLSPSRFAHLFAEHMGLPFRRYLLWRKLTRAILGIGRGQSLSTAAHTAGFADAAHLTRTFQQMFGVPPSVMMRGEFFEVPAPFEPV